MKNNSFYFSLFLAFSISYTNVEAQSIEKLNHKYEQYIAAGETEKAEKVFRQIALLEGEHFFAILNEAEQLFNKGKTDASIATYGLAIGYHANHIMPTFDPSFMLKRDSLYARASQICGYIVELKPSSVNYATLAVFKSDVGDNRGAIDAYTQALSIYSMNHVIWYNRGLAYRRIGEIDSAIADYSKSIELKPDYADGFLNRGFAYLFIEEYQKAIEDLSIAISLNSDMENKSYCYNNIGFAWLQLGNLQKAEENMNISAQMNPINSYVFKNLALLEIKKGNIPEACKHINKAIELGFVRLYGNEILSLQQLNCR